MKLRVSSVGVCRKMDFAAAAVTHSTGIILLQRCKSPFMIFLEFNLLKTKQLKFQRSTILYRNSMLSSYCMLLNVDTTFV